MTWLDEVTARHGAPAVERGAQLSDRHHRQVWVWTVDGKNHNVSIDRYSATRWEARAVGDNVAGWMGTVEPTDGDMRQLCIGAGLLPDTAEEIARLRLVAEAATAWRRNLAYSSCPQSMALIAAVDALGVDAPPAESAGRVWAVPSEPDVATVRDRHGRVWVRSEYEKAPNVWWLTNADGDHAFPHNWHELVGQYGPLTEVAPAEAVNA